MNHERQGEPPINILTRLRETDPEFLQQAEARGVITTLPPALLLRDLKRPPANDATELIRHRFLCRGGSVLFPGPTGKGKSSAIMQIAINFAAGRPCFGLEPIGPLKILIVQAENDEGDMAEMRDGILEHIGLTAAEMDLASANIRIVHEDSKTGLQFADLLDKLLAEYKPDLVFIDPAFSYLGGDASSQKEVTPFLRNMLNPVIHRHGVGLWLNHHTNKPAPAKEKGPPVDLGAYLGAGSAEWCNWARAVIALRPVVNSSVFKFSAPKRGARLRWQDADGNTIFDRYIAHAREPGKIYWRDADPDEIPDAPAPTALYTVQDLVNQLSLVKDAPETIQRAFLMDFFGKRNPAAKRDSISKALFRLINKAKQEGMVREGKKGLSLTPKAVPQKDIQTTEEF